MFERLAELNDMTTLHLHHAYKPSGVPWLGDMPEHWDVRRGGWLFRKMDRAVSDADEVITCFRDGTVTLRKNRRTEGFTESLKEIGYQGVRKGDLVIHQMDSFAGAVGVSDSDGKGTPVYSVCHPNQDADPFYYAHIVREMARSQWILALAKGIRERSTDFRYSEFALQALPLPPLPEQQAIVRYLDHVDRRIRRYVSTKRKLIGLLEAEKQAIVNRAVIRGLDPNVRLKPSGVEWLGDVPEHWETFRVGHFSKVGNGSTPSRGNAAYWADGVHPWLNSSSVNQGTITRADQFVTDLALHECHLPRLRPGSVLVGITGQGKTRGMSAVLTIDATINQHMAFITPKTTRVSSHYLQMCLTAGYSELRAISGDSGSTKAALTCEDIKRFMVVLPPRDEQERLLSEVRREHASVDTDIARARRQIELLQEYRTRLIADVVTGKLDVREAAAQLPDEAEEPAESRPQYTHSYGIMGEDEGL